MPDDAKSIEEHVQALEDGNPDAWNSIRDYLSIVGLSEPDIDSVAEGIMPSEIPSSLESIVPRIITSAKQYRERIEIILIQYMSRHDVGCETEIRQRLAFANPLQKAQFKTYMRKYHLESAVRGVSNNDQLQKSDIEPLNRAYGNVYGLYHKLGDNKEIGEDRIELRGILLEAVERSIDRVPAQLQLKTKLRFLSMTTQTIEGEDPVDPDHIIDANQEYFRRRGVMVSYDGRKRVFEVIW